jgi:hypothetical protein
MTTLRRRRNQTRYETSRWFLVVLGSHRYFLERAMIITAIVVTGIVFTMIGAAIGYILGYIEAENFYKIKHRERP